MNQNPAYCPVCNHSSQYSFSGRDLMFNLFEPYHYYLCSNCELIFQHPLPSAEKISSFYPDHYDVYAEQSRLKRINPIRAANLKIKYGYSHLKTNYFSSFIARLTNIFNSDEFVIKYVENGKLLDIGCGNGRFLHGMKQLGWGTKGVEFNASAVSVCKKSNLDVHHGDLFSAKFDKDSFDVVNLSHVIEHVPDPKALFKEISRILKSDGLFVVKTPNSKALGRAFFDTNWYANDIPRHLFLFSKKNLMEMGKVCGLEMTRLTTNSSPKIILNSVDYVLKNSGKPSKKIWWRRLIAKPYVLIAKYKKQGDEIHAVFKKI